MRGALSFPLLMYMSEAFSVHFHTYILGAHPGSSGQGKNAQSLRLCFLSIHIFCLTLLTLRCAFVNEWHALCKVSHEPCSAVSWCLIMTEGSPQKGSLVGGLYWPTNAKRHPTSLWGERPETVKACGLNFPLSVTFSLSFWPFCNCAGN